jgi:hypothetical protein
MGLKTFQAKNVDYFMAGKIVDTDSYYSAEADRYLIEGTKEINCTLEIDSAENKTEGYIQALYGRIIKATGSISQGKISLEGLAMLLGQTFTSDSNAAWLRIRRSPQLPLVFFDFQSLFDADNGSADNRLIVYKSMISNFDYSLGQDNFAEVSYDWNGIFTLNPVIRSDSESLEVAAIGRQASASETLGGTIETAAAE